MTRTDAEVEDLIHDLRDRIQFYEPLLRRKMNRLNEEALIRRAYTVLTNIEMNMKPRSKTLNVGASGWKTK